jgi:hypothetical protein
MLGTAIVDGVTYAIVDSTIKCAGRKDRECVLSEYQRTRLIEKANCDYLSRNSSPNVSSENAMIVPGSLFRCGFVIELIA